MLKKLIHNFFPTPNFLKVPCFGVDISDESLKFVELIESNGQIKIGRYGGIKIPTGIIESGKIKDLKKMEELLVSLKKEQKIKAVRVSLPEEQVYLFKLRLEKEGLDNIREGIELCLEEYVPVPADEAVFDYDILFETNKFLEIQVAVISKNVADDYLYVFKKANILVKSFELEAQAIARAVIKKGDPETSLIVDFGERRAGIFIVSNGIVAFTSTLEVGGLSLTKIIEKSFNTTFDEAEKIKRKYGLERNSVHQEVFSVLLNSVSVLRDEISKHFIYWHTSKDEAGNDRPPIRKIILCGGDSNLKGLPEYLSVSLRTKVELADVWKNMIDINKDIPPISFEDSLTFASALGLALGDFNFDYD
jgi:type IV pilus assembly protein PilM